MKDIKLKTATPIVSCLSNNWGAVHITGGRYLHIVVILIILNIQSQKRAWRFLRRFSLPAGVHTQSIK